MPIQGKTNFRDQLPLPSKYKGTRDGLQRPIHLREAKLYLYKNYPSFIANDFEVDDAVIFKGYEYLSKGYAPIIVGVDKDARAYSNLSLYNYTLENPEVELIPNFGSLRDTGKKITGEGFLWFCFQWVNGDSADSYKPSELAKVKFGEVSTYNLLKDCKTHQNALQRVIEQYKAWYPEPFTYNAWNGSMHEADYISMLDLYLKCSRMIEVEGEIPEIHSFLRRFDYGIFNAYNINLNDFMLESDA